VILRRILININEYMEGEMASPNSILLLFDDNVDNLIEKVVAQAISLDIRGDYGFFLNDIDSDGTTKSEVYEWNGDLFNIVVDHNEEIVKLKFLDDESDENYTVKIDDWQEALECWKEHYLHDLGFLEFNSRALSHMLGTLILAQDMFMSDIDAAEIICEAIKRAASRYGVASTVIYRDCRKVTGLYSIQDFYNWTEGFLRRNKFTEYSEFVLKHIADVDVEGIFSNVVKRRLGITL